MALDPNTNYIHLNAAGEIQLKIEWVTIASNVLVFRPDGTQAPSNGSFPAASDGASYQLYGDGSIARYRQLSANGESVQIEYAQPTPGTLRTFGPDGSYTHGALTSETSTIITPDGKRYTQITTYSGGLPTSWSVNKVGTAASPDSFYVQGSYSNGSSTITLTGARDFAPITNTGPGDLTRLISNLDFNALIGNDGSTLIGNDGSTLVGNDGASLIGNDGSTLVGYTPAGLIGNDTAGLVSDRGGAIYDLSGGRSSILAANAWHIDNQTGRLISDNGAILAAQSAQYGASAHSMQRGFRTLSTTSFTPVVDTAGPDLLVGGDGNDILRGGLGPDRIEGGIGDDTLYGANSNFIRNGSFETVYQPNFDSGGYAILTRPLDGWTRLSGLETELFKVGGAGTPSDGNYGIDLEGGFGNANIAISQVVRDLADGQSYHLAFDVRKANASANAAFEVFWGGAKVTLTSGGAQSVSPSTVSTTYYLQVFGGAGSGSDKNRLTFREIGQNDYFGTLLDNVRLYKDGGSYTANDPARDDSDSFVPGTGSDVVFGHGGGDVATFSDVGLGTDHYSGGSGIDLLIMDWSASTTAITYRDLYENNVPTVSGRIGLAESYSRANPGQPTQVLYFNEVEKFFLRGGSAGDYLKGGALEDTLFGNDGADTLIAGSGADTLFGGSGRDVLSGGDGNDVFRIDAGDEASGEVVNGDAGGADEIRTSSSTLNLSGMLLNGIELVTTAYSGGTAFTVDTASHLALLRGSSGSGDSVNAVGMTLSSAQRSSLFANGFESVTDQSGTHTPGGGTQNGAPTITDLSTQTIADKGPVLPFGGVTIADPNGDTIVATITISHPANGTLRASTLSSGGFTATGVAGQYVSARVSLTTITSALRALVFDPTENQAPVGGSVATSFSLTVNDGKGGTAGGSAVVTVQSLNDAPVISSDGGGATASLSVRENATAVTQVIASDLDPGSTLTYSLVPGADAAKFSINPTSGVLAFIAAPDFELPGSSAGSNVYGVTVRVSDTNGGTDQQSLAITVTDQNAFPGGSGPDNITGDNGPDTITAMGGDDTIFGGGGNDTITAGTGTDIARYNVSSVGKVWTRSGDTWTVNAGAEGIDRLTGIEILRFSDRDVRLGTVENDLGGDGRADILWRNDSGALNVWNSTGSGFATRDFGIVPTSWTVADTADFGGDGKADILWRNADGGVNVWTSSGTSFTGRDLGVVPTAWKIQAADDVTGDGRADILWRHDDGSLYTWTGTGTAFTGQDLGKVPLAWKVEETGDVNADGKADIVWRHDDGTLNVWTSTGSSFASNGFGVVPTSWHIADVADVNGDARADIVWRNDSGALNVWTSTGTGFAGHDFGIVGNDWTLERAQDVGGDGRADILWRNDNGTLNVWTSTGTSFTGHDHGVIDPSWHIV